MMLFRPARSVAVDLRGAHVVVTGATGGIGRALAREMRSRGARVSLVARREAPLRKLAGEVDGVAVATDLSDPDQLGTLGARLAEAAGTVDVLVNNAALLVAGRHDSQTAADARLTLETNLIGPIELTRQVLPSMLAQGRGAVIDVCSLAGDVALPNVAAYAASKAGLAQFTLNLQRELRRTPVRATLVVLGEVAGTHLHESGCHDPVVARIAARFNRLPQLRPEFVAHRIASWESGGNSPAGPPTHDGVGVTDLLMTGVDRAAMPTRVPSFGASGH